MMILQSYVDVTPKYDLQSNVLLLDERNITIQSKLKE